MLGIKFQVDLNKMIEINYQEKITKWKKYYQTENVEI